MLDNPHGFAEVEVNLLRLILEGLNVVPDMSIPRGYHETIVYLSMLILESLGNAGIPDIPEGTNTSYTRNRNAQGVAVWGTINTDIDDSTF